MSIQKRLKSSAQRGFTLIELAIVLVIVGMLVGLGSGMMGMLTTAIKVREAKDNVEAAVQSVTSWASANNRLPDATSTPDTNPVLFKNVVTTPKDSWGRDLVYLYDANLAPGTSTKDTICGRRSTYITLQTIDPPATVQNVAFVIISKGDDPSTVAPAIFTTLDGTAISTNTALVTPPLKAVVVPNNTDDIVRWVTLDELRTKVGCQGAPLKIVNNELPYGVAGGPPLSYTATIIADGGVAPASNYRWCIETLDTPVLPTGLNFTPAVTRTLPNKCDTLVEQSWGGPSTTLTITGAPATGTEKTYSFTVYARDFNDLSGDSGIPVLPNDNDNVASKTFVLTINPAL